MIQAVFLANLGAAELDACWDNLVNIHDAATGLNWLLVIHAAPGEAVFGNVIRGDPGTMGRTLFHFRASPYNGRHSLDYPCRGEGLASPVLLPMPVLCAFIRAVRAEMEAEQAPDLEALAPLHLGVAFVSPPVELRPDDFEVRLRFESPNDPDGR